MSLLGFRIKMKLFFSFQPKHESIKSLDITTTTTTTKQEEEFLLRTWSHLPK